MVIFFLMGIKITFLNGYLDVRIYIMQLEIFIANGYEHLVCNLHKFFHELMQALHSWNKCFDKEIKTLDFDQNKDESYVYKKVQ